MNQLSKWHVQVILGLLLIIAFVLRWYIASQYPFLHDWDERFHALVSKHLMETPFTPRLRSNPILPYNYKEWCCNYIWLQKQPFFMWQIALSMKIFGVGVMQVRLPSIIMSSLLILPTYRIAYISSGSRLLGIISAVIGTVSGYQMMLVSGVQGMDHNDMAFLFYIIMSIYSFVEYTHNPNSKFWILAGLFSGVAVLNKWLVGLLVFSGWGLYILFNNKWRKDKSKYFTLIGSVIICFVVFIPWQIYIHSVFPQEAKYIQEFVNKHLSEAVEGHEWPWDYYFNTFGYLYGTYSKYLFFVGLFFTLKSKRHRLLNAILITYILVIYTFFTIVPSKLLSFPFVIAPLVYIVMAYGIYGVFNIFKNQYMRIAILIALLSISVYSSANYDFLAMRSKEQGASYPVKKYNTERFKEMRTSVPEDYIIFIAGGLEYIDATFFSDHQVYNWWVNYEDFMELKKEGYKMAVVKNQSLHKPPKYMLEDEDVLKIDVSLMYKEGYTPK